MSLVSALRSRIELWAQAAGLFATAWLVWSTSVPPFWRQFGYIAVLTFRIALALEIAVCALAWGAVIGLALNLMLWSLNRAPLPAMSRTFAIAVWFAPATILILPFSPIGLTAGLALAVSAARIICAPSFMTESDAGIGAVSRDFVPAFVISAAFQTAIVSFLMSHVALAAGLLTVSAALVTSLAIGVGAWREDQPPNLPRTVMGLVLTVLLASMLVQFTGGAGSGSGWGWGFGSGTGWGFAFHSSPGSSTGETATTRQPASNPDTVDRSSKQADRPGMPPESATSVPGDYPGVILWPEIKPVTTLIAPPTAGGSFSASTSHPLTIPFGGEYWMFRWPYSRPPKDSYFKRGTPLALYFKTTDRAPLMMEARHKLVQPIGARCCSRIQLAILNADPSPGTITLELVLIDREAPAAAALSLGRAPVTSVPDLKTDRTAPVPETVDFPFPPSPRLEQFDEIKVIFHRSPNSADKSARISITRFVLLPLG